MNLSRSLSGLAMIVLTGCAQLPQMPSQANPSSESGSTSSLASSSAESVPVTVSGALTLGASNAPVSMLLFTNYDCPYCADFERELMPRLNTEFIEPGLLRVTIVPVPLQKYPNSLRNGRHAVCGVLAGSGADVHRALFAGRTSFPALAECLSNDDVLQNMLAIQDQLIRSMEVTLIPSYVIDGAGYTGLPEFADLRGQINAKLNAQN